jgi:hypothetical protein
MEIGGQEVRTVTLHDGRLGCAATPDILRLVKIDPRVRLDDGRTATAEVVRSGRLHAEVHGRLRRARRLPSRTPPGPVLLIRPE